MSGTLLEQTRADHEEVERLERLIVKDLQREVRTQKERLHQNHHVRNMLDIHTHTDRGRKKRILSSSNILLFCTYCLLSLFSHGSLTKALIRLFFVLLPFFDCSLYTTFWHLSACVLTSCRQIYATTIRIMFDRMIWVC